jgi:hypothetical protein
MVATPKLAVTRHPVPIRSARILRQSSSPLITGIIQSEITSRSGLSRSWFHACRPSAVTTTSCPMASSLLCRSTARVLTVLGDQDPQDGSLVNQSSLPGRFPALFERIFGRIPGLREGGPVSARRLGRFRWSLTASLRWIKDFGREGAKQTGRPSSVETDRRRPAGCGVG